MSKDNNGSLEQNIDKRILRYLVVNAEFIKYSTGTKSACLYVYPKPGMNDEILDISNIDFVQEVYRLNGIELKKHVSHFGEKQTEVLCISLDDYNGLDKQQMDFFNATAPLVGGNDLTNRSTLVVNSILRNRALNAKEQVQGMGQGK